MGRTSASHVAHSSLRCREDSDLLRMILQQIQNSKDEGDEEDEEEVGEEGDGAAGTSSK
jgi:hypothetical protein